MLARCISVLQEWLNTCAHARQAVLSCESVGASTLEVPSWRVASGRYLLQLSLTAEPLRQPGRTSQASSALHAHARAAGRGHAGAGEGACEPEGAERSWRVCVAPSADAKACSLVEDDSFARYLQVCGQSQGKGDTYTFF